MDATRAALATLIAVALGGCSSINLHRSELEENVQKSAGTIVVGETTRSQVREALGEPLLASDYWQFDVFKRTDWNADVLLIAPIVLPGWNEEEAYVLVSYADDGRVADTGWAMRTSGPWSIGYRNIAEADARQVRLATSGSALFLMVQPQRRDDYLRDSPGRDQCRVLVGALEPIEGPRLAVDGQPGPTLPGALSDALVLVRLTPGSHRIRVGAIGAASATGEFQCAAGESWYASLALSGAKGTRQRAVGLELSKEMPASFRDQSLLIWGSGQWLVESEPGP